MSYQKVQTVLESDRSFVPRLIMRDTEVTLRGGQKIMVPRLVFQVGEALRANGFDLQSAPKNVVLATAASIGSDGFQPPTTAPASVAIVAEAEPVERKAIKPSPPKPVIVKGAKPSAKPMPRPAQTADPVAQFIDNGAIHRYQCAIASAQLLAALSQLFEKDEWPGAEERRKKLNDLIDDVEKSSSQHVNLSVKQIIRAQTAEKANREG